MELPKPGQLWKKRGRCEHVAFEIGEWDPILDEVVEGLRYVEVDELFMVVSIEEDAWEVDMWCIEVLIGEDVALDSFTSMANWHACFERAA